MAKPPKGVTFTAKMTKAFDRVLTAPAIGFVAALHRGFEAERQRLLARRAARAKLFDRGLLPDFLPETAAIRDGSWKVAPIRPGANVSLLGFTLKGEVGEAVLRVEYLFLDGKVYALRSSPA